MTRARREAHYLRTAGELPPLALEEDLDSGESDDEALRRERRRRRRMRRQQHQHQHQHQEDGRKARDDGGGGGGTDGEEEDDGGGTDGEKERKAEREEKRKKRREPSGSKNNNRAIVQPASALQPFADVSKQFNSKANSSKQTPPSTSSSARSRFNLITGTWT